MPYSVPNAVRLFKASKMRLRALMISCVALLAILGTDLLAQTEQYQFTAVHRRRGDQIQVEIWAKLLNGGVGPQSERLGSATIPMLYNTNFLVPSTAGTAGTYAGLIGDFGQAPYSQTDSISSNIDQFVTSNVYSVVRSVATAANISLLSSPSNDGGSNFVHKLELNLSGLSATAGFRPDSSTAKGSFIGSIWFDILNEDQAGFATATTGIVFVGQAGLSPGNFSPMRLFRGDGTEISSVTSPTSRITFVNPTWESDYSTGDVGGAGTGFKIAGITILNPTLSSQTIDRDQLYQRDPAGTNPGRPGYPIYFERSGLIVTGTTTASTPAIYANYGSTTLAYVFHYRESSSSPWIEIGRVAETTASLQAIPYGNRNFFGTNEVTNANAPVTLGVTPADFLITTTGGNVLPSFNSNDGGYGGILRVVWATNANFPGAAEFASLRIAQLVTTGSISSLLSRDLLGTATTRVADINQTFVLGRNFYAQLNGQNEYLVTQSPFSSPTQFTVSAWVNLSSKKPDGSNVGLIATGEPGAAQEGAWMLYLANGNVPTFRVRRNLPGAVSTYIATVQASAPLTVDGTNTTSPSNPSLIGGTPGVAGNWYHIAATVQDNVVSLYIDGELVDRQTNNTALDVRALLTSHRVWVGVNPTTDGGLTNTNNYFHGGIKDVQIWRAPLSDTLYASALRRFIPGVASPTVFNSIPNVNVSNNVKRALELYFGLQGSQSDGATETQFQNGANSLNYQISPTTSASLARYRPDRGHIRLTSPRGCEGISNLGNLSANGAQEWWTTAAQVRWAGFGLGDIATPESRDLDIQFQIGSGNWTYAMSTFATLNAVYQNPSGNLIGSTRANLGGANGFPLDLEVTSGSLVAAANNGGFTITSDMTHIRNYLPHWQPFFNWGGATDNDLASNAQSATTSTLSNFNQTARLRVRGRAPNVDSSSVLALLQQIQSVSGDFALAPYFALQGNANTRLTIPAGTGLNMANRYSFAEAWIRPYQFPTGSNFYPILTKGTSNGVHYAFNLLSTGQLEVILGLTDGTTRRAVSDINRPIIAPITRTLDTLWSHVGVLVDVGDNVGASRVTFYIDGNPQNEDSVATQFGTGVRIVPPTVGTTATANTFPTYIGWAPARTLSTTNTMANASVSAQQFLGGMREVRFWNGLPGGSAQSLTETPAAPSALTSYIQGSANTRLDASITAPTNLVVSFALNGGEVVTPNYAGGTVIASAPASAVSGSSAISASYTISTVASVCPVQYIGQPPVVKIVEPREGQQVRVNSANLRVRWIGFDYDVTSFASVRVGGVAAIGLPPVLEFSTRGGGALTSTPYQFVGGTNFNAAQTNSLTQPVANTQNFVFGTTPFAAQLNVGLSDPDANDDGVFTDQGQMGPARGNGRFRINGGWGYRNSTFNSVTFPTLQSEGPLFNLIPPSNYTVRIVMEGYFNSMGYQMLSASTGTATGNFNMAATYATGGLKVKLYNNSAGQVGSFADSAESADGYYRDPSLGAVTLNENSALNPIAPTLLPGTAGSTFANVPFVLSRVADGNYWVVVDHLNHLPMLSKAVTPYLFSGDPLSTWAVESGYDFTTWNGVDGTPVATANATFPATGNQVGSTNQSFNVPRSNTALIFNDGRTGFRTTQATGAMVAGDVEKNGQIDAGDRIRVRLDAAAATVRSDVTGDATVNALDRDIVDRNFGRVSSLFTTSLARFANNGGANTENDEQSLQRVASILGYSKPKESPFEYVSPLDPEASQKMIASAQEMIATKTIEEAQILQAMKAAQEDAALFQPLTTKIGGDGLLQSGASYTLTARPRFAGDSIVEVPIFITSTGSPFAMGHATFGITYDNRSLEYVNSDQYNTLFTNPARGYDVIQATPYTDGRSSTVAEADNVRRLDVMYDALTRPAGSFVPTVSTQVGVIRFRVRANASTAPLQFGWHRSTAVLDTRGQGPTGTFTVISSLGSPRGVTLSVPNGGERYRAGRSINVTWRSQGIQAVVRPEVSLDGGNTWTPAGTGSVAITQNGLTWNSPANTSTDRALARLVDVATGQELVRSENTFAIVAAPNFTSPTPLTTMWRNMPTADNIRWNIDRNEFANNIRLEYTLNGTTWTAIGLSQIRNLSSAWSSIPTNVNTCTAIVRMIDMSDNSELARSEQFKISTGMVSFTAPAQNQVLNPGAPFTITWSAMFTNTADIQLSTDGGRNWTTVMANASVGLRTSQVINIPDIRTGSAVIRFMAPGSSCLEYSRVNVGIGMATSVTTIDGLDYNIGSPVPNPLNGSSVMNITLPRREMVSVAMYNMLGQKVATYVDAATMGSGTHTIALPSDNIPAGMYYIRLTIGNRTITREAVISR